MFLVSLSSYDSSREVNNIKIEIVHQMISVLDVEACRAMVRRRRQDAALLGGCNEALLRSEAGECSSLFFLQTLASVRVLPTQPLC